ncbi:MAG: rhomboid family intramembrane serine protease [Chitinispirillia bacterium]|nr:rhomboid family intramembrane serine protease [Chitinispirillia bacterium]MCL2241899.1 rhomboid family intramembrane serine protease [Chitinispirillia bacterium]
MYYDTPKLSPCIKGLIAANVILFIGQMLPIDGVFHTGLGGIRGNLVTLWGANIPVSTFHDFQLWRLVTYMFLHSEDLFHILFNMLALWWFAPEIEDIWGAKKFLIFYFVCGVGAGLFSVFYLFAGYPVVFVIGASGAVMGVLTAYAVYYPERTVLLFFVIPMKIRTIVIGYAAVSVLMSLRITAGGVSHITHLGGIVVAWCFLKVYPSIEMAVRKKMYIMRNKGRKG